MATIEKANTIQGLSPKLDSKLTWKNDQPRMFQLVDTGKLDTFNHNVAEGIQGLEVRRGASYPAETTIYDKFEEGADKIKVIRNITGRSRKQKENGDSYFEDQVASLVFDKDGLCIVQPGNKNMLARVLLSDNNGTNPYRRVIDSSGSHIPVLWEEVKDYSLEKQEIIRLEELKDFARSQVKNMELDNVKSFLLKYDPNYSISGKQTADLRFDLRQFAEKDPRYFLSNAPDEAVKLGMIVEDAILDGVLTHNHDSKAYFMSGSDKAFFTYPMESNEDPKEALVKYLISNKGKADKAQLLTLIKQD